MVSRLVVDMLRRLPVWPLAFLGMVLGLGWGSTVSMGRGSIAVAVSLVLTYVLGPIMMLERLRAPLIPYLPVSRRDVWRATWLMSTLAPAALAAAVKLPAMLTTDASTWSRLTLSTTMDVLYAGAGCALIAAGDAKRGGPHVRVVSSWLLIAGLVWPIVAYASLPTEWRDIGPSHLVFFGIGLALTTWSACYTPGTIRTRAFRPRAASSTAVVGSGPRGILSGLPRLVVHEFGSSLALGAFMLCLLLGMSFVIDGWRGRGATLHDFLAAQTLLLFDPEARQGGPPKFDPTQQFVWFGFFAAAVFVRFPQLVRHLRVLPLGTARLQALLLAWPALLWSAAWILLALLHRLMIGPSTIADYHLPMFFVCVGLSALGIAVNLRFTQRWIQATTFPLVIPFARIVDTSPVWLMSIGALAFGLAAALNVWSLSRGATYKRRDVLLPGTQSV